MIFDRIPDGMETDDYEQAIVGVKNAVSEMNGKLDELLTQINIQIKKEFHVEKDTNLKACLIEWYERQSQASKQYILSTGISKFMSYLDQLATNDEEEIVRKLSRIVTDMYVEDWNDILLCNFRKNCIRYVLKLRISRMPLLPLTVRAGLFCRMQREMRL